MLLQHTGFLVYYVAAICWFSMLEIMLFVSLLSFYLRRQIGGEWCGFKCCGAAIHSGVILFYHGLNSATAMLLFTIVLLHTSLFLALVFMVI